MRLFYDEHDQHCRDQRRTLWLEDLGAVPYRDCDTDEDGFVFSCTPYFDEYCRLIAGCAHLLDQPGDRAPLLRVTSVQGKLYQHNVRLPMARTWPLVLDKDIPEDLQYPLSLRQDSVQWKTPENFPRRIHDRKQLQALWPQLPELGLPNIPWLAQSALDLIVDNEGCPDTVRLWFIDKKPKAWSRESSCSNPLSPRECQLLKNSSQRLAQFFGSRFFVFDFVRLKTGGWVFLEAAPGSLTVTRYERLFKSLACLLVGRQSAFEGHQAAGFFFSRE